MTSTPPTAAASVAVTSGMSVADDEYFPASDGWRPTARQRYCTLLLSGADELSVEQLAEEVFVATNAPEEVIVSELAATIRTMLNEHRRTWLRSLSVGDTITVRRAGDPRVLTVACKSRGWRDITHEWTPQATDGAAASTADSRTCEESRTTGRAGVSRG